MRDAPGGEVAEEACLEAHAGRAWAVAWAHDGVTLASCGADKAVRTWRRAGGAGPWAAAGPPLDGVHTRTVRQLAFAPGAAALASASFDATAAVWSRAVQSADWEAAATLEGHESEVKGVAWSASGSLLATCGRDRSVWVWEAVPGSEFECAGVLHGHTQDVKAVAWHPLDDVLVSASYDDTVKVWREEAGGDEWSCAQTLERHGCTVWGLSFERAGACRLATCDDHGNVLLWSTPLDGLWEPAGALPPSGTDRPAYSVDWCPLTGALAVAGGDDSVRVYVEGMGGWEEVARCDHAHAQDVNCVRWNPATPGVLASAGDDGLVRVWHVPYVASLAQA